MLTKGDIDWLIDSMKRQFASKDELQTLKNDIFEKLDKFLGDIEKHANLMPLAD